MLLRVPGHRILGRGAPHTGQSCQTWPCDTVSGVRRVDRYGIVRDVGVGGHGHASCECGWTGPHQFSGAARRRDHRAHKRSLRSTATV